MSDPNRPYKSHLFNFVNRQSRRIRDRFEETLRHLRVAAEWSAQLLALPFHWLLHPQQWAGPKLGSGRNNPALTSQVNSLSDPPVDRPLERVLTSLRPWFELPEALPPTDSQAYQPPQIVLSQQFFEQVRQQLATGATPDQLLPPPSQPEPRLLPPQGFGQLVINLKNAFAFTKQKDLIIQGIACLLENRQLVLTSTDNDLLDVLSGSQQQQLQQRMGLELGNYGYDRRLQWALAQQRIGLISLVDADTQSAIAPLDFLWRKLQWLEQLTFNLQCRSSPRTAIVPRPTIPLPSLPLRQPLARLDRTIAQIETQEIQWGQKLLDQLHQGLVSLRETPRLEASIEKMSHLPLPLGLPQSWQAFKTSMVEKLPSSLTHRQSAPLDRPKGQIESTEPDPFQIQAIIQAAIAYFFGSEPSAKPVAGQTAEKLTLGTAQGTEAAWLSWEDLFCHPDENLSIQSIQPFAALPESDNADTASIEAINRQPKPNQKLKPKSRQKPKQPPPNALALPSNLAVASRSNLVSERITDDLPESAIWASGTTTAQTPSNASTKPALQSKPWEVELEAAFDWIETEAKPVGYSKHLLEYILDLLDAIVVIVEETLKKVWRWCYQQYLTFYKTN